MMKTHSVVVKLLVEEKGIGLLNHRMAQDIAECPRALERPSIHYKSFSQPIPCIIQDN